MSRGFLTHFTSHPSLLDVFLWRHTWHYPYLQPFYFRWRREKAAERKKLEALGLLPKTEEYSPAKNKQVTTKNNLSGTRDMLTEENMPPPRNLAISMYWPNTVFNCYCRITCCIDIFKTMEILKKCYLIQKRFKMFDCN